MLFDMPKKQAAPRSKLRCATPTPVAVADLVPLIQHIDHIEPRCQCAGIAKVKDVARAQVDLSVVRQVRPFGIELRRAIVNRRAVRNRPGSRR